DQLRDLDIHRSLKHTTEPVQNTDFLKSEKLSISTGCAGNMISITSRPALSVTVFIRIVNTSQVYN
ncbi:TPA: hypothetical protein ACV8DA_004639, partial [Escherichia coli]